MVGLARSIDDLLIASRDWLERGGGRGRERGGEREVEGGGERVGEDTELHTRTNSGQGNVVLP